MKKKIILIIALVLVIGLGIFLGVKLATKKDKIDNNDTTNKVVYTLTDPLNAKIELIRKEVIHDKYIGVDLSRYEEKEDNLRKEIKKYVYKDSDVESLNLSEEYNRAYDKLLRKIRGINGSGYSREYLRKELQKEGIQNSVAEYVIDNANIDYNDQAIIRVYKYLSAGNSKQGINDKLIKEEFTEEEIEYALSEIEDVDFYEQAIEEACLYKYYKKYDKATTAKYLRMKKFTEEEIEYAVNTVFEKIK